MSCMDLGNSIGSSVQQKPGMDLKHGHKDSDGNVWAITISVSNQLQIGMCTDLLNSLESKRMLFLDMHT